MINSLKNLIEWTEGGKDRGKKIILFLIIGLYLFVSVFIFGMGLLIPSVITTEMVKLFITITGVITTIQSTYLIVKK